MARTLIGTLMKPFIEKRLSSSALMIPAAEDLPKLWELAYLKVSSLAENFRFSDELGINVASTLLTP